MIYDTLGLTFENYNALMALTGLCFGLLVSLYIAITFRVIFS